MHVSELFRSFSCMAIGLSFNLRIAMDYMNSRNDLWSALSIILKLLKKIGSEEFRLFHLKELLKLLCLKTCFRFSHIKLTYNCNEHPPFSINSKPH